MEHDVWRVNIVVMYVNIVSSANVVLYCIICVY